MLLPYLPPRVRHPAPHPFPLPILSPPRPLLPLLLRQTSPTNSAPPDSEPRIVRGPPYPCPSPPPPPPHPCPRAFLLLLLLHGGLRCSQSGTMGPGAYPAFGLDDVADYRCGRGGAVIVCLCAMHDPEAYTTVPAANTAMRQGYLILHNVSHHVVLGVAYSGAHVNNANLAEQDSGT